jgi:hypothetical protein
MMRFSSKLVQSRLPISNKNDGESIAKAKRPATDVASRHQLILRLLVSARFPTSSPPAATIPLRS